MILIFVAMYLRKRRGLVQCTLFNWRVAGRQHKLAVMQCRNVTTLWNLLWDDDGMDGIGGTGIVGPQ